MIIYKITNLIDGKCYIGQSTKSFNKRYNGGKWWKSTTSPYLKNAAKFYGHENFSVEILKEDVQSLEELNIQESFFIKEFNCMIPLGYNCQSGGKNFKRSRLSCVNLSLARRKTKEIKLKNNYSGEIKEFETITDAANFFGRPLSNVINVLHRERSSVGVWTLPDVSMKYWIFSHLDGKQEKVVEGDGLSFRKKYKLSKSEMSYLRDGFEVKGWIATFLFAGENCKTRHIRKNKRVSLMLKGENFHKERLFVFDPKQNICLKIRREPNMIQKILPYFRDYQKYQIRSIFFKDKRPSVKHILVLKEGDLDQKMIITDLT